MAGNGKKQLEQWMGQLMEVELADTRRVRGYLVCTDNGPNIVLNQGVERWPDDAGPGRQVGLVMVAPKNIKNLWHVALEPVAPAAAAGDAASARRDEEENTGEDKDGERKEEQSRDQMDHTEWNRQANQLREIAGGREADVVEADVDCIEQQWRRRQARQDRLGTTREPNYLFKMAKEWCARDGRMQPAEPLSPFKWTDWEVEGPRQAKQWRKCHAQWETKREEWIQMLEPSQRAAIDAAQQAAARYRERVNLKVYDGAPPPRVDETFRAELMRLLGGETEE